MTKRSPFEDLPDRTRVCVMLRAEGFTYDQIANYLNTTTRSVRHELESATGSMPGILDHRRTENTGRSLRIVYLLGLIDGGAHPDELCDYLDALVTRSAWLRPRVKAQDDIAAQRRRRVPA